MLRHIRRARVAIVAVLSLGGFLIAYLVYPPIQQAIASQTEAQRIALEAGTCVVIDGSVVPHAGGVNACADAVISCNVDFVDSQTGAATVDDFDGFAKSYSGAGPVMHFTLLRRPHAADSAETTVSTCQLNGSGSPQNCDTNPSHSVNESTDYYYVQMYVASGCWEIAGAAVGYSWVNGP